MKYVILCILLCIQVCVSSQVVFHPRSYAETITSGDLKKHLYTIAGPAMEGRETATTGQQKAASYITEQFKRIGLQPAWKTSYLQSFPVFQDSLAKASLVIDSNRLIQDTDFVVSNNSTFNVSFTASEVLFVGYGRSDSIRDDYQNVNARGKIVMVIGYAGKTAGKGKKQEVHVQDYRTLQKAAQKNGAIAMLIVDKYFPRQPVPAKGSMYVKDHRKENIPNTFFISDSVARMIMGTDYYIAQQIMKSGPPPPKSCYVNLLLELDKSIGRLESSNVLGIIEGDDKKEEVIVITAHYDHLGMKDSVIYYGADDDGSGTSALLELAEAFAKAAQEGKKPRRSIIFMAVSGEEKGLWGSSYYSENPAFPLDKTSVNINIDMIGRVEKGRGADSLNYVFVVGDNRLSSDLRPISEKANSEYINMHLDYKFNDPQDPQRIYYRSDHYNFAKNGVPAIFYFSGLHDDYHRPTDTPDKINYDLLEKRTQLIFYTAWDMANREEMVKRDLE